MKTHIKDTKLFNKTYKFIDELKPDLIILIDFPDFNLRLAKKLNKKIEVSNEEINISFSINNFYVWM